jgi:uncharacterized LabA/DUF88 family protein
MNEQLNGSMAEGVAIFWDWQNIRVTEEQIQCVVWFGYIQGNIKIKKVYSDWNLEKNRLLQDKLFWEGFEAINVPSSKNKPNRTDNKLIRDCLRECLKNSAINTVILVSGDGDFQQLVRHLINEGKKVIVIAKYEKNTSQKLIERCNKF